MTLPFDTISIEQVAKYPRPGMAVPGLVRFTPDSTGVTYVYSAEGNLIRSLWRYDIATGQRRILAGPPAASTDESALSREEELRRERARLRDLGVTSYEFAAKADRETLLIPGGGKLLVAIAGAEPVEIPGCDGALDPRLSPDGTRVAFVRDNEVWVADVPGGNPRQLTAGASETVTNGVAEFIAAEELDRDRGFWWSPDGTRIAFVQADSSHIPEYPIVHQGKDEPEVERHRYPFAGKANALVRLGVVGVEGGPAHWMDIGSETDIYIARVAWRPDNVLTAQLLSRDQKDLWLIAFEADGPRGLVEEHGEALDQPLPRHALPRVRRDPVVERADGLPAPRTPRRNGCADPPAHGRRLDGDARGRRRRARAVGVLQRHARGSGRAAHLPGEPRRGRRGAADDARGGARRDAFGRRHAHAPFRQLAGVRAAGHARGGGLRGAGGDIVHERRRHRGGAGSGAARAGDGAGRRRPDPPARRDLLAAVGARRGEAAPRGVGVRRAARAAGDRRLGDDGGPARPVPRPAGVRGVRSR
ncbi:MAG: DPP IV N-terminal domain-containing protein [Thermoflexaceae bacterium]|nr:DPP IV N-terminal domain-containing protein [Thermoflexaceae bacterium]